MTARTTLLVVCVCLQLSLGRCQTCPAISDIFFPYGASLDQRFSDGQDFFSLDLTGYELDIDGVTIASLEIELVGVSLLEPDTSFYGAVDPAYSSNYDDVDQAAGKDLFYRISVISGDLDRAATLIKEGYDCDGTFAPTSLVVVTWRCLTIASVPYTHQMVLVTDGVETYAILNYLEDIDTYAEGAIENPQTSLVYVDGNGNVASAISDNNGCSPGQWLFKLNSVSSVAIPPTDLTCGCPVEVPPTPSPWSSWSNTCKVCGGCGTRTRSRQLVDGRTERQTGPCPPVRCVRGKHNPREWLWKKGRNIGRSRRCCWSWAKNPSSPQRMSFPRRCKAKKCRGWTD